MCGSPPRCLLRQNQATNSSHSFASGSGLPGGGHGTLAMRLVAVKDISPTADKHSFQEINFDHPPDFSSQGSEASLTLHVHLVCQAVAFLAGDTNRLAVRLARLKDVFPTADVAAMVVKQPALLMGRSEEQLAAAVEKLRQLLLDFDIDWWVQ